MKNLDEIKKLMVAGDTVQADGALKELLAAEPNNLQAKMLYGTCRQLLGDEETFKRIHDELEPQMLKLDVWTPCQVETLSLWKKYKTLWEVLILGALVLGVDVVGITYYGHKLVQEGNYAAQALYAGSQYGPRVYQTNRGPSYREKFEKKFIKTDEDSSTNL